MEIGKGPNLFTATDRLICIAHVTCGPSATAAAIQYSPSIIIKEMGYMTQESSYKCKNRPVLYLVSKKLLYSSYTLHIYWWSNKTMSPWALIGILKLFLTYYTI